MSLELSLAHCTFSYFKLHSLNYFRNRILWYCYLYSLEFSIAQKNLFCILIMFVKLTCIFFNFCLQSCMQSTIAYYTSINFLEFADNGWFCTLNSSYILNFYLHWWFSMITMLISLSFTLLKYLCPHAQYLHISYYFLQDQTQEKIAILEWKIYFFKHDLMSLVHLNFYCILFSYANSMLNKLNESNVK